MQCKCKDCGSTNIEIVPDEKGWSFSGAGMDINHVYVGDRFLSMSDPNLSNAISEFLSNQPTCDHLASGNACCPCGRYLNVDVKAVCVMVDGKQTWPTPYGKNGLTLEDAWKQLDRDYLDNKVHNLYRMDEADKLKIMWDRQMITGKVYITRLREIRDKKQESCERMK